MKAHLVEVGVIRGALGALQSMLYRSLTQSGVT